MLDLTAEDRELLQQLNAEDDPTAFANKLYAYYHDGDRADRTPRSWLYLHMGMAVGMMMKVIHEKGAPS